MKIINKSRKVISIDGEPLLPGYSMELSKVQEENPIIVDYLITGFLADASETSTAVIATIGISDFEKAQIAEEAVAKYKAEQEAIAQAQAQKKAEIKEVKSMNKDALVNKAIGMGIEVLDSDTTDTLKEKILKALNA